MSGCFRFETSLSYETAAVRFNIDLKATSDAKNRTFSLTVHNLVTGQRLPFTHEACPAVHDFTRGYSPVGLVQKESGLP